jgi:superfamily II DNA helicase RecQ
MALPVASRIKRIFVDEPHDCFSGHKDRDPVWRAFARNTLILNFQRSYCTATMPPHLHPLFCEKSGIPESITVIRGSTDRPELGYHVLAVNPSKDRSPLWESLKRLVHHLKSRLQSDERIILFFQDEKDADLFSDQTGCAKYHSKLPKEGSSTKRYYFDLWAKGDQVVMAASTAFQQGVDYPWVAFVIY